MKALEARKYLRGPISIALVGLCFCVNALVGFESFTTGNEWLDTILGFFIRVNEYSYFPFVSWIVFPVVGFGVGSFCQRNGKKKTAIFAALILGMPDAAIVDIVTVRDGVYYALHPVYAVAGYGIIMLEFALAYLVLLETRSHIPHFMLTMSKNVARIYIVQWAVIALLSPLLAAVSNIWVNIAIAFFVLIISCFGGMLLKKKNLIRI